MSSETERMATWLVQSVAVAKTRWACPQRTRDTLEYRPKRRWGSIRFRIAVADRLRSLQSAHRRRFAFPVPSPYRFVERLVGAYCRRRFSAVAVDADAAELVSGRRPQTGSIVSPCWLCLLALIRCARRRNPAHRVAVCSTSSRVGLVRRRRWRHSQQIGICEANSGATVVRCRPSRSTSLNTGRTVVALFFFRLSRISGIGDVAVRRLFYILRTYVWIRHRTTCTAVFVQAFLVTWLWVLLEGPTGLFFQLCRGFAVSWRGTLFCVFLQQWFGQQLRSGCRPRRCIFYVNVDHLRLVIAATMRVMMTWRRYWLGNRRCDEVAIFRPEASMSAALSDVFTVVGCAHLSQLDEPHNSTVDDVHPTNGHLAELSVTAAWRRRGQPGVEVAGASVCSRRRRSTQRVLIVVDCAAVGESHRDAVLRLRAAVLLSAESHVGVVQRQWSRHRVVIVVVIRRRTCWPSNQISKLVSKLTYIAPSHGASEVQYYNSESQRGHLNMHGCHFVIYKTQSMTIQIVYELWQGVFLCSKLTSHIRSIYVQHYDCYTSMSTLNFILWQTTILSLIKYSTDNLHNGTQYQRSANGWFRWVLGSHSLATGSKLVLHVNVHGDDLVYTNWIYLILSNMLTKHRKRSANAASFPFYDEWLSKDHVTTML